MSVGNASFKVHQHFLLVLVHVVFLMFCFQNTDGLAQSVCEQNLREAEQQYNIGDFDRAIGLLTDCLDSENISKDEKMRAYRLLGLTYLAKDYLEEAKNAVRKLLDMVPNYKGDPVQDPPPFTKMVEELKQEQPVSPAEPSEVVPPSDEETKVSKKPGSDKSSADELGKMVESEEKGGSKKWLYIGGGAVVAGGVVAAILLSGKGDDGTVTTVASFPMPPGRP